MFNQNRTRLLDPSLGCEGEAVKARFFFKPVEFGGFKISVIQLLPNTQKLNGVAVSEPSTDQIIGSHCVLVAGDVCDADVLDTIPGGGSDFCSSTWSLGFMGSSLKRVGVMIVRRGG